MENSEIGALKPLEYPFPPPRRRPLMSDTYTTLLRILSSDQQQQILDVCKDDDDSSKLGKENEVDELVGHQHIGSENLLVNGPAHKESDNLVVQHGFGDGKEGNVPSGYRDFTGAHMEVDLDLSNRSSDAIEGGGGDSRTNDVNDMHFLAEETQNSIDQILKEPRNRCSSHESGVKEFDHIDQIDLENELSVDDVCAAVESCFGMDAIAQLSQPDQITGDNIPVSGTNLSEEMEHGLRLKEMELENLISLPRATDSSVHVPMDEEIDGEVSGDFMIFDKSDNDIVNDVGDVKKVDAVDENDTFLGGEFIRDSGEEPEHNFEKVFCSKDVETRKVCVYDSILDSEDVAKPVGGDRKLHHPAGFQFDATSTENAKENKYLKAAAEDVNIGKRKKRRGGKREKKKANERIKRAEKNRKLGVKRLKLLPVVKPKAVIYCRHYLNGRCLEGEKCKFSHDTTPLTKAKPCRHFARQSCMKGDDCPFDHQLSKYPCDNYASKGFCSRRAHCLFSHEITAKAAAVKGSTASNLELTSPSVPSNSNSVIPVNTYGMSHKHVNSTSVSAGLLPSKSTKRTVLEPVQKPAACTPKGVTFSSPGKSLQDDARKHEEASLSSKADDVGTFRSQMIHSKSGNIQNPNGCIRGAPMRAPQGINFLSFGRAPSAAPSGNTLSGLFNMDHGANKSQLGDMNNSNKAATCVTRDVSVKDDNQSNLSYPLWSMNQMSIRHNPAIVPRGINFLSVEKAAGDRSHPNEFNSASPVIQGRQSAPDKTSLEMPFRQSSCLLPSGQSLNQPAQKCTMEISSSLKAPFLATPPGSIQKALQSTLASAAKFNLGVKYSMTNGSPDINSSINHKAESSKDS